MLVDVVKVSKSGGSLILIIPADVAKMLKIKPGQRMAVRVQHDKIIYEIIKEVEKKEGD